MNYIGPFIDIPAPDVYTDEKIMVWILDEYERIKGEHVFAVVTGKPVELGGSKARSYSTSLGGIYVLEEMIKKMDMDKFEVSIAVQGFGNVGENAARILHERGYKVIAVSDSKGGIINKSGLDIKAVMEHKAKTGSVVDFEGSTNITNEELLTCECDILIPAALSDQLNKDNAKDVKAKMIIELANAGGVVVSYFEWIQNLNNDYWEENKVLEMLKKTMITAFNEVHSLCNEKGCRMRKSAYQLAIKRILNAERLHGNL